MDAEDILLLAGVGIGAYLIFKKDIDTGVQSALTPLQGNGNVSLITPLPDTVYNFFQQYPASPFNPTNAFTDAPNVWTPLPSVAIKTWKGLPTETKQEIVSSVSPRNVFTDKASVITPLPNAAIKTVKQISTKVQVHNAGGSYSNKTNTLTVAGQGYSVAPQNAVAMTKQIVSSTSKAGISAYNKAGLPNVNPYKK